LYSHSIILEEASLELVPKRFWNHEACKVVEARFGIPPKSQILDDNFHHKIIATIPKNEKRGRPDIVHFALLDIVSTPAYKMDLIRPIIRTINGEVIVVKKGVRLPRTELRFYGVMSKILRSEANPYGLQLFEYRDSQTMGELLHSLNPSKVSCLSTEGIRRDLNDVVSNLTRKLPEKSCVWVVGGFAHGHFSDEVKRLADDLISISSYSLPAHVVTARLSYEIERSQKISNEGLP
jgi:rRNA small subunit pseudouridine methyltransferase Nep1